MKLFNIFKKKGKSQEKEKTYLDLNINKFYYMDGGTSDKLKFLQGSIKQLTQYSYRIEKGKQIFEHSSAVFTFKFDRDKKITEELSYHSENVIGSIRKYFDFQSNKMLAFYGYSIPNILTFQEIYDYNEKGECISYIKYGYDNNGNEIKSERLFYETSDKCFKKEIIENSVSRIEVCDTNIYNPLSPLIYENLGEEGYRKISYFNNSATIDTIETFDKFKNFLTSKRYDNSGNLEVEIEVTYDQEYRRKTYSFYNYKERGKILSHYHYDENGFLVKLIIGNPTVENNAILYENDKYGNVLKKFSRWSKTIPEEEFEYEYDHYGNWTKRTMKYKGKLFNIRTRMIEYYTE